MAVSQSRTFDHVVSVDTRSWVEVFRWLHDNVGPSIHVPEGTWYAVSSGFGGHLIAFQRIDDALLFKLTWGGR